MPLFANYTLDGIKASFAISIENKSWDTFVVAGIVPPRKLSAVWLVSLFRGRTSQTSPVG